MCGLCSNDFTERERERKKMLFQAEQLEKLASKYKDMAHGKIEAHGKTTVIVGVLAKSIVRELVEEWV